MKFTIDGRIVGLNLNEPCGLKPTASADIEFAMGGETFTTLRVPVPPELFRDNLDGLRVRVEITDEQTAPLGSTCRA